MRVISGKARGVVLKTPDGIKTRPTTDRVKEAMFSIIQFELPGAKILDLFAGTGQLGIEALSRGAASAVFIDSQETVCAMVRENLRRTKFSEQSVVIRSDYLSYLSGCNQKFDIVFLDPPYAENFLENALNKITEIDILQSGGIIVAEMSVDKKLFFDSSGLSRSKDYKYGKTVLTLFRKE